MFKLFKNRFLGHPTKDEKLLNGLNLAFEGFDYKILIIYLRPSVYFMMRKQVNSYKKLSWSNLKLNYSRNPKISLKLFEAC